MKKFGFRAALAALLWVLLSVPVWAADVLIPVGRAVGLELEAAEKAQTVIPHRGASHPMENMPRS